MKILLRILILIPFCLSLSRAQSNAVQLLLKNSLSSSRTDSYVSIPFSIIKKKNPNLKTDRLSVTDGGKEIPYQVEINEKGEKSISLVADFKANETKAVAISGTGGRRVFDSRTYAELAMKMNPGFDGKRAHGTKFEIVKEVLVPKWHIDHDGLFKYEGPGWESDKVGYRLYLDWRNATDIFGKKTDKLILNKVGINDSIADNNESYHSMQDWGMDIFKVGNSLGIGSFGTMHKGKIQMVSKTDSIKYKILMNGPVKSEFQINYFGWQTGDAKYNLDARFSIIAGSRLTKCSIGISPDIENIAAGLAKYPGTNYHKGSFKEGWSYIAVYGAQSLSKDNLGIALFYKTGELIELTEDDLSRIVLLKPLRGKVEYYFCAAWEKELNGIKNEMEFIKYLNRTVDELNHPVTVEK